MKFWKALGIIFCWLLMSKRVLKCVIFLHFRQVNVGKMCNAKCVTQWQKYRIFFGTVIKNQNNWIIYKFDLKETSVLDIKGLYPRSHEGNMDSCISVSGTVESFTIDSQSDFLRITLIFTRIWIWVQCEYVQKWSWLESWNASTWNEDKLETELDEIQSDYSKILCQALLATSMFPFLRFHGACYLLPLTDWLQVHAVDEVIWLLCGEGSGFLQLVTNKFESTADHEQQY